MERVKLNMGPERPILWIVMDARAVAIATLLALSSWASILSAQVESAYAPKALRFEILQGWERAPGAPQPPEIVAGIYERDFLHYDFHNKLAITIDDAAPNAALASELDTLEDYGVKATFFIVGSYFLDKQGRPRSRARELLRRIVDEGHQIGSHGFWHERLDLPPYRDDRAEIEAELDRNQSTIDSILGYHYPIRYFRPPNGAHSTPAYLVDRILRERGQYLANWTITSFDWNMRLKDGSPERLGPAQVIARTLKQAREDRGGVVLLHGFPQTAEILDDILGALACASNSQGSLEFSSLDDIMRRKYEAAAP